MDKKKKIIIGVVALVVLGGIGYFLYNRSKKKKAQGNDPNADIEDAIVIEDTSTDDTTSSDTTSSDTPKAESTALGKNQYRMGYLSKGASNIHAVHLLARPKKGTIVKNNQVKITGTKFDNTYTVNNVWIDKNGNVGALYLGIKGYTPTGKTDRTFEGKGIIEKL